MNGKKIPVALINLDTGERTEYPSKAKLAEAIGYDPVLIAYYLKARKGNITNTNLKIEIL
mgnify:CR=1 FL=1